MLIPKSSLALYIKLRGVECLIHVDTEGGPKGAKMTIGPKGVRKTVGIPGTGLYYTEHTSLKKSAPALRSVPSISVPQTAPSPGMGLVIISVILLAINLYGAFSEGRPQAFIVTPFLGLFCVYAFSRRKRLMGAGTAIATQETADGGEMIVATPASPGEPTLATPYQYTGKGLEPVSINMTELNADLSGVKQVASMTDPAVKYDVDIVNVTCSCNDFTENRSYFKPTDIRRVCKHLEVAMRDANALEKCDSLVLALIACHCSKEQFYRSPLESGEFVYFAASKDNPWVEVFARTRKSGEKEGRYTGDYAHYGFSVDKSEWSYGEAPAGAREIRKMLKMLA